MEISTGYVDAGVWSRKKRKTTTLSYPASASLINILYFTSLKYDSYDNAIPTMFE
jgi:hypothetical protein